MQVNPAATLPDKEVILLNPEAEKVQSYPWFDWLRFVLASVVVLDHAGFKFTPFLTGNLAVSVFFALSGWLIGGILLRTETQELPRFFFNRATRIWIPYFLAIILLYGAAALREGVNFFWLKYLVMDVTFTHQLFAIFPIAQFEMPLKGSGNQFWSLSVEEQFYLLSPLVMLFIPKGKTLFLWLLIGMGTLLLSKHCGPIALGVIASIMQRDFAIAQKPWVRLLALILIAGSALALSMPFGHKSRYFESFLSVAVVVLLAVPGARSKLGLFLGGLSFPLYLNHWLGLVLMHSLAKYAGLLEFPGLPFITYLTAVVFTIPIFWLVDRQVLKRRNDWFSEKLGWGLGLAAYVMVIIGLILGILMHQYGPRGVVPPELSERIN
jgi:peptidoglycan/LPS O-acetylase OafA/YrhL